MTDNVELLRDFWSTWRQGGGAALVERHDDFFTPDAEWRPPMRELTGAHYAGREGRIAPASASYDREAAERAAEAIIHGGRVPA